MLINLKVLKARIIGRAAEGRSLRSQARKYKAANKVALKERAKDAGSLARAALAAYGYLRGKGMSVCESSKTRGTQDPDRVLKLVEEFWTPPQKGESENWATCFKRQQVQKDEFLKLVAKDLKDWGTAISSGTAGEYKSDNLALWNAAAAQGRTPLEHYHVQIKQVRALSTAGQDTDDGPGDRIREWADVTWRLLTPAETATLDKAA